MHRHTQHNGQPTHSPAGPFSTPAPHPRQRWVTRVAALPFEVRPRRMMTRRPSRPHAPLPQRVASVSLQEVVRPLHRESRPMPRHHQQHLHPPYPYRMCALPTTAKAHPVFVAQPHSHWQARESWMRPVHRPRLSMPTQARHAEESSRAAALRHGRRRGRADLRHSPRTIVSSPHGCVRDIPLRLRLRPFQQGCLRSAGAAVADAVPEALGFAAQR